MALEVALDREIEPARSPVDSLAFTACWNWPPNTPAMLNFSCAPNRLRCRIFAPPENPNPDSSAATGTMPYVRVSSKKKLA
jgi:hypothetical protein